jgi:hypothetical protein
MTVSITSSVRIALVNGVGVTINTPAVPNYTTDDIYNASNPAQTLTQQLNAISGSTLLSTVSIDCTMNALVLPMFTVPAGEKLYVTAIYFALTAIGGSGSQPSLNVGISGNYQEIIDGITNATLFTTPVAISTVGQLVKVTNFPTVSGGSGVDYAAIPSGTAVKVKVTTASTDSTYTVNAFLFGFLSS